MDSPVWGVAFAVIYIGLVITWVLFFTRRLRPWSQRKLGDYLGFTIVERIHFRNRSWEIKEPHTWRQGCFVMIVQSAVDFGCLAGPIFMLLGVIGIIMIVLSG